MSARFEELDWSPTSIGEISLYRAPRPGRPVAFDAHDYKNRNVVERAFNHLKNWRGLATRYDKHALVYRGASSSHPSRSGFHDL